jgi:DNA-binding Lrp family transcriptional regulator
MENQVRIFRDKPFGWFDKPVMRYLREKYGQDKKTFLGLRSTYLAVCEMESDFENQPINAFNKTVGTYAGLSRQVAGKYVRVLEQEGLIKKTRMMNPATKLKGKGTGLQIMSSQQVPAISARMAGYPTIRVSDHSDTPPLIKNIRIDKKLSMHNNVRKNPVINADKDKVGYYAEELADKLNDHKSLSYYRIVCARYNPNKLLQKASEIVKDGGARKPGAVFAHWIQTLEQ